MIHPYGESYVDEIVETQGRLFGRMQDDYPDCDGMDFVVAYLNGSTRAALDSGDAYLANLNSSMLRDYFFDTEGYRPKNGEPLRGFAPDWMGRFYARYQWQCDTPSARLSGLIAPAWLRLAYSGLHDLDLSAAVEKVKGTMS